MFGGGGNSADKEKGNGGARVADDDIIAQFQTTRIRSMIGYNVGGYKRIFQLTKDSALTLDPSDFSVTNTFPYDILSGLGPDPKADDQFVLDCNGTQFVFKTAFRSQLLCQFWECITKRHPNKFHATGPYDSARVRKNGSRVDCRLFVHTWGIVETDLSGATLKEYHFVNINRLGIDESSRGFFFENSGRIKIFLVNDLQSIMTACQKSTQKLGLGKGVSFLTGQKVNEIINLRNTSYANTGLAVSVFDVNKFTKRYSRPMPRQMHITENYIVEKDVSGFQFVSFQKISSIYSIVRNWNSPREFTIEYEDGTSRSYTCAMRDTLLAMIMDSAHGAGNRRVIVTGEVSDNLRLMPRFAEEEYQSSIKDAFFGASSIEAWFLGRLAKVCKTNPKDIVAMEAASKELNANVACPGISTTSDPVMVKTAVVGLLQCLNHMAINELTSERVNHTRPIVTMLQSLFRICTSVAGYKGFVEVKELDVRLLMLQLVQMGNDFINYWTLQLLFVLCNCPITETLKEKDAKSQMEFVNKHTLLTDKMLTSLINLMASRVQQDNSNEPLNESAFTTVEEMGTASNTKDAPTDNNMFQHKGAVDQTKKKVAGNAALTAHLPPSAHTTSDKKPPAQRLRSTSNTEAATFYPNSLVVVGSAGLLESIVSSKRSSSSPELLNSVLELLETRCEVLINMLRSSSFLIMENAAILMFVLLKNRPSVGPIMKEMALSEGLTLKHFYHAVFSPSSSHRFISRFLVATWMSGSNDMPGKALLRRMIPSGLVEYLKMPAITEEHRKNLDEMEDEFYANMAGQSKAYKNSQNSKVLTVRANDLQVRMRQRLTAALSEAIVQRPKAAVMTNEAAMAARRSVSDASQDQTSKESVITNPDAPPPPKPQQADLIGSISDRVKVEDLDPPKAPPTGFAAGAPPTPTAPENYRIMFHAITNDHKMPDIIWNEQTRLELRSALEAEMKEFDKEQRLRGAAKLAWNYQQFSISYPSLRDEMQVGPVYIRHFLEAGDAFIKALENPSHIVLFEKLFRRVLVNVDTNAPISILCTKCLVKLYDAARDRIGYFDDMMLTVRMLEQARDMELQHSLLDLLESLSVIDANLHQLLETTFVDIIIKYAALAHLNPDQIGNVLARATRNQLLIQDGSSGNGKGNKFGSVDEPVYTPGPQGLATEDEELRQLKRNMWVPDDIACPKVWFVAPPGQVPPPAKTQKGPYRISELIQLIDQGVVNSEWVAAPTQVTDDEGASEKFEANVDTGLWKKLSTYFQLRIQMLFPGKAVYSPAEVSSRALNMLRRLAAVHKSANSRGIAFYPIPVSKRIMSEPMHLSVFAQLLLSNNTNVVEVAAELLRNLVEFNPGANSKLYLSGAFFFVCKHTANNFTALAKLLFVTHMKQSFHDQQASVASTLPLSQRSILGNILPSALISILLNYGPERFASIFTGDFDTPEVIWNAGLRRHVVEMIEAHLGNFAGRLRQHNLAMYEYCPIPRITFVTLDPEPYVHEYYLRNLCDEVKFRDWPIAEPLILLRETIERWRGEMKKGIQDTSVLSAMKVLELKPTYTNADLRTAYKSLAKIYHPDKNPNGRDMFEKIHVAYELLSSVELKLMETNLNDVALFIKTQNIIYRRFPEAVADQKYPAYPLLNTVLNVPSNFNDDISAIDMDLILVGTELCYRTVGVSPLNALEFVKANAVPKLHQIVCFAMAKNHMQLLTLALKAFTAILQFETGQNAVLELCPNFSDNVFSILQMDKTAPLAVENCIEIIARGCSNATLQIKFVEAGVIWLLMPMLLSFDHTLQNVDYNDESQRSIHNQTASNMHAILATKALGRMGGYMHEDLASPEQPEVKRAFECLLTLPLAKLLRNRRPWELLKALNENVEKATKIWNVSMRHELLTFLGRTLRERKPGSSASDLKPAYGFKFSALTGEMCIGGVYIRIFIKVAELSDIDNPSAFCRELLDYIWSYLKPEADENGPIANPPMEHRDYSVEALKVLVDCQSYIANDIADSPHGVAIVFDLLALPSSSPSLGFASQLLTVLGNSPDFINTVVNIQPPVMWKVLQSLCTCTGPHATQVYAAAEAFASHPIGLGALLECGGIPHLLGCLFAVKGHASAYATRLAAVSLLSKFLWNPTKGAEASNVLRRFLPEPLVLLLRSRAGNSSLQVLDEVSENPELIWTAEMQLELRESLNSLLSREGYTKPPVLGPEYYVKYEQISNELYVGNVYIRLYLKQPTFKLSNPILFLEKLIEFWESSFNTQCPAQKAQLQGASRGLGSTDQSEEGASTALVLGSENFLALLTSSMVCVLKSEPSVLDHMLSWGFTHTLCDMFKRAVDLRRMGSPVTSVIRLLYQLSDRADAVDSLAGAHVDIIQQLTMSLGGSGQKRGAPNPNARPDGKVRLPKESAFIIDLLKKIYQCRASGFLGHFVSMAIQSDLPNFLLDHVLGASPDELQDVRNPAAMRIHAVDTIKAIIAADEFQSGPLKALLDVHPGWAEYREQSHDLFITDVEKTDPFLIQDSTDKAIMGLLTDGSAQSGISSMFTSLGRQVPTTQMATSLDNAVPSSGQGIPPKAAPAHRAPTSIPASAPATSSRAAVTPAPVATQARPVSATPTVAPTSGTSARPNAGPTPVPVQQRPSNATPAPTPQAPVGPIFTVTIVKGEDGLGLDIGKIANGSCLIRKLKDMPAGRPNPAANCRPELKAGDIIIGINGQRVKDFDEVVRVIRALGNGPVQLTIERA